MSLNILSTRTGDYVKAVLASHWPYRSGRQDSYWGIVSVMRGLDPRIHFRL